MSQVLVVASKVKGYIKEKSGMNTSASVIDALTKIVENELRKASRKIRGRLIKIFLSACM